MKAPAEREALTPKMLEETFAEFLKLDVANGDARPDTIRSYKTHMRQFVDWCQDKNINPVCARREDIKEYRRHLVERGLAHSTISLKLTTARRFYQGAVDRGLLQENPAEGIRPPRERKATNGGVKHLTEGELELLLRELNKDEGLKSLRDKAMIYLMVFNGLRSCEVSRMNLADLAEDDLLVRGKGQNGYIRLGTEVGVVLGEYLQERRNLGGDAVFIALDNNSRGQRITRDGVRMVVNEYFKVAGIKRPGVACHALRHTYGTLLYKATQDLQVVKEELRHKSVEMASRYAHTSHRSAINYSDLVVEAI